MKDKNLDYSSMIGLFLILLILTIFTYFNSNNNNKNKEQEKKFLKNKEFLNSKKGYFFEKEKNHFFLLENNVLRLKISNVGGMINEVLLKKYKAYDASLLHHSKNLFLIKNSSFLYKMSFSNKKGLNIDTTNLLFQPFLFENQK